MRKLYGYGLTGTINRKGYKYWDYETFKMLLYRRVIRLQSYGSVSNKNHYKYLETYANLQMLILRRCFSKVVVLIVNKIRIFSDVRIIIVKKFICFKSSNSQ